MSVYKRRVCSVCGKEYRDQTISRRGNKETPAPCQCGGEAKYRPGWQVEVKVLQKDGSLKPRRKTCKDKAEAEAFEASLKDGRAKGEVFSRPKDSSFLTGAKTFLGWVDEREKEKKLAPGSAKSYRERVNNHLIPYFGGMDLRNIEWEDVDEYRKHRFSQIILEGRGKGNPPTPATINREVAALKRLLSIAVQKKILKHHNLTDYEMLNEDNERERFLTQDEIGRLLAECSRTRQSVLNPDRTIPVYPPHLRMIVVLALNTGLRIDGVLTLRWEEIDWRRNEIVKMVKHHRNKPAKPVHIPMNPALREELKTWQARHGIVTMKGYVIPSTKKPGEHILITSNFGLGRALKRAQIEDFTFHDFRHTFCTHFLEQYPDKIEVLCKIVGHTSSYMTRRYAHITERATHAAMAEFSLTASS